jgi:hypothetical protein
VRYALTKGIAVIACSAQLVLGGGASNLGRMTPTTTVTAAAARASGAANVLALPDGVIWAYDNGEVVRSADDGAHWRVALPTWPSTQLALQVTGAFFLNAADAWAITSHSWPAPPGVTTVWRTTNGGASWQQGTSVPGPVGNTPFDSWSLPVQRTASASVPWANRRQGVAPCATTSFGPPPTPVRDGTGKAAPVSLGK